MKLFIDTETTGLTRFDLPESDSRQPRLVQVGALLCEDWGQIRECYSAIVQPEGYEIPEEVSKIHGITTEIAKERGRPLFIILSAIERLFLDADLIVAHNVRFDMPVVMAEFARVYSTVENVVNMFEQTRYCTMLQSTPVCKIPNKGRAGFKWPKLGEAYMHFFGEVFHNAHDALTDVMACKRIYFDGLKQGTLSSGSKFEAIREAVENPAYKNAEYGFQEPQQPIHRGPAPKEI